MLKEAKKFVQDLEEMLNRLSQEFNKSVEELDAKFTDWYGNGGQYSDFEAFERNCRYDLEEEAESAAYGVIYENMRNYAFRHGYDLQEWEIDQIIEGVEENGSSVLECSDETLRDSLDDWIANNQK